MQSIPVPEGYAEVRDRLATVTDRELGVRLGEANQAESLAAGAKVAVLAEMMKRGLHHRDGCRNGAEFAAYKTGCSKRVGTTIAAVIDAADDIVLTMDEVVRGSISVEKAALSASIITDENRENAQVGEAIRLREIHRKTFGRAARYAKKMRGLLTPDDQLLPATERLRRERGIKIINHRDGTTSTIITSDPESTQRIDNLVGPTENRMAREDREAERACVEGHQPRTASQRRFDAHLSVLSAGANADAPQPVAEVAAILREDTYGKLVAVLADATVLHPSTVERLCCSSHIVRSVIGADEKERNIGTMSRVPTKAQRRVLRARDRHCRFHGCCRAGSHAHHIEHWEHGGETSLDNLVLLCPAHHHAVHEGGFGLRRRRDGCLKLTRPDGTVVATMPYQNAPEVLPLAV